MFDERQCVFADNVYSPMRRTLDVSGCVEITLR